MKKWLMCFVALTAVSAVMAQNKDVKKLPSIGLHYSAFDFQTASDLRTRSIGTVIREKQWYNAERLRSALTLSYNQGISNYIDFQGRLTTAFLAYPSRNTTDLNFNDKFYVEADANVNLKLLTDDYIVVPYLQAGLGIAKERTNFMAYMPLGAGLQVNLWEGGFLHLNTGYRVPVGGRANYSLFHSVGVIFPVADRKMPPPPPPPPAPEVPKDRDGDGVLDINDDCPDVAGLAAFKGCPDSDKDGIADKNDKCPNEAGVAKYGGCPIPDSDKDGLNDENDKCPTVAGVARYEGCPIPDGDGDGVNDEEDKCPAVPGIASNGGCPEIKQEVIQKVEMAAKNIYFNTGSAVIQKKSFKPLDEVVKILNENPTLLLDVAGHTDNTGNAAKNQELSDKRAAAVKAYLVGKGLSDSRITSAGYGPDQPIADNKTAAGRAKNRRVELKLRSY